ncbi:unnamed protein product [Clonostachys byssicola]|uniref:Uncharacterized protein n=1 Tax=Clonostachys byssicola TaxID=160290 RepID=A0A9N9UHA7_9HYPO|nr:unnamed protein product [Clonostachys byssicola]
MSTSQRSSAWSVTPAYDSSEHQDAKTTNDPATPDDSSSSSVVGPSDQDFAFMGSQFDPKQ